MTLLIESKKSTHISWPSDNIGSGFEPMCVPNTMQVSVTQPFINTERQKHAISLLHTPQTPLLSDRHNGIAFFPFAHFNLYCETQNFWNSHSPCEFDISRTSHSCALPIWKAFSKQLSSVKVKNGSCLCLLLFLILNCLLIAGLVLAKVMNVS